MDREEPRVEARLLVHEDAAGLRVGVQLDVDAGWHIYAPDPGETGLPTEIALDADEVRFGELVWPPPRSYRDAGMEAHGYEGRILVHAGAEPGAAGASPVVRARIDLLACKEKCIPAVLKLERELVPQRDPEVAALFAAFGAPPLPDRGSEKPAEAAGSGPSLLHALLLAFVGGLILNGMPCVLPVLAIKVFSVAELAQHSRRETVAHGVAYGMGVLVTMWLLAGVVLLLRAAGTQVGWGFHFQEPVFVASISVVVVLFALNLLGVYEISLGAGGLASLAQAATGRRRSFFEGLLAVVLATPCTAPFLGTAVGLAFAGSALLVLGIFTAIGLGLAAPFVAVTFVPALGRWIPRAGPWMLKLRVVLGFALLASAVWLVWILGRAAGLDAVTALLGLLVAVGFGAWTFGSVQRGESGAWSLGAGAGAIALGAFMLGTVEMHPAGDAADGWQTFDADAVRAVVAAGQPAFVYFTADWCLTCKVNEKNVLSDTRVQRMLEEAGFARFRGDWTRRDETIRAELARHGRAGVPLYLVFSGGAADAPRILPELLTVDGVLNALRVARGSTPG
jgi:thiol:disulfide interchange protein DsbD